MSVQTLYLKHMYALIITTINPSMKAKMHTMADYVVGVNQY